MKVLYLLSYKMTNGEKMYRRGSMNVMSEREAMKFAKYEDAEKWATAQGLNMWKVESIEVKDLNVG